MRRISYWAMSTLTLLVLLFSYHTSRSSSLVGTAEVRTATTTSASSGGSGRSSGASSGSGSSNSGASTSAQTVAGTAVMTRYGPVQVQITIESGKITAAETLQVPMESGHDRMINAQAVPTYNGEVVSAQSAQIDMVSGATVTYNGYVESLQAAIDQAHL